MLLNLPPTDTALFLNGIFFDMDVVDIFTIFESVRQEIKVMEGLYKIGEFFFQSIIILIFEKMLLAYP